MNEIRGPGSTSQQGLPRPWHRPAVAAVVAFGVGICLDRLFPLSLWIWISLTLLSLLIAIRACRRATKDRPESSARGRLASCCVLLLFIFTGATRQHLAWNMRSADDISTWCSSVPEAARVRGIISIPIEMTESKFGPRIPSWMEVDRSTTLLTCEAIEDGEKWVPVSGLTRMTVSGHLVHVRVGDRVEVLGQLSQPRPPSHPGGFDFPDFLRRQGIGSTLRVEHPVAVRKLGAAAGPGWTLARWRESIRNQCNQIFFSQLDPEQFGLASSLLIGDRTMLTDELQDQFAQTGTMHLLAISGLHVGILIGLILSLCRFANLSSRESAATLMVMILLYVFITDLRPPVLRAGLLALIAVVGTLRGDRIDRMNALAASALVLLLWNPADLFDIGAQLSFLAVGAILWSLGWMKQPEPREVKLSDLLNEQSRLQQWIRRIRKYVLETYKMTAAVTLATLPITMATFHLVAPVGILLNILLIPYIAVVLALGYLLMFGGLILPVSAPWLAIPFSWSLSLLQWSVEWGQKVPWGHHYIPALPAWWLIPFYILLGLAWPLLGTDRTARWGFKAVLCWCVLGLLVPFVPRQRDSLRCTFLSVGHGLASLIEFPGGETILYDAGTIGDGERATRAVTETLWSRGIHHVDAVVVSHADHDHFSGLFGLLERVPVRTLFISRQFLDFQQQGVRDLCELAFRKGIKIQLLQAEDRLKLGKSDPSNTRVEVLYPPQETGSRSDNANSIVVAMEFAGRSILLTGDLEKEGLADLLKMDPRKTDVLLSPHHGGKVANVLKLYEWAEPTYAVVSSGDQLLPSLQNIPQTCTLLNTAACGTVTFEIKPNGEMDVSAFSASGNCSSSCPLCDAAPVPTARQHSSGR
ncbi:DNA internalization-related competence protein ComEC/Rec2 [Planctomicrobium sp. SH661]|uniref:DNA internalization-related competence protein ComEC/Rec2 n=1 Tax=Planctomicrobium sp. SH661 TaxID=3448124 RepID=UPI003F5C773D